MFLRFTLAIFCLINSSTDLFGQSFSEGEKEDLIKRAVISYGIRTITNRLSEASKNEGIYLHNYSYLLDSLGAYFLKVKRIDTINWVNGFTFYQYYGLPSSISVWNGDTVYHGQYINNKLTYKDYRGIVAVDSFSRLYLVSGNIFLSHELTDICFFLCEAKEDVRKQQVILELMLNHIFLDSAELKDGVFIYRSKHFTEENGSILVKDLCKCF